MARYDDLDTRSIAFATAIGGVLLLILILGGRALSYTWQSFVEDERNGSARYSTSDAEIAAQKAVLLTSGKVEDAPLQEGAQPTTRFVVPIEKAEKIVGEELSAKPKT